MSNGNDFYRTDRVDRQQRYRTQLPKERQNIEDKKMLSPMR
jgi:hypothetical protein